MKISNKIYGNLVNRVPGIRSRYHEYRDKVSGAGSIKAWGYLAGLNARYYLLHDTSLKNPMNFYPDKNKRLYIDGSESSLSKQETAENFAQRLANFDVISFDVFDTLIFRTFSKPTDLFYMVGADLGYLDFERIRQEMEWKAREKKYKNEHTYEVTFEEIWCMMESETGIPKSEGETSEWKNEKKYSFANPYFLQVVNILKKYNKKLVITSDMYLRKKQIQELLKLCGYPEFDEYFVSCEYGASKGTGQLYKVIKEGMGTDLSYVHIGDNMYSDIKKAEEAGFKSFYYRNVNEFGKQFRAEDMSAITGSMYRGIVNAHLHNGLNSYSMEYEFGFVYGGLFVLGYCQFIHEYVSTHDIDKILFLARDGDILNQVYTKLYQNEAKNCEYVYWSRLAATKMAARYFKYDYFRRFLYHKVNQGYTFEKIFESMEISDMLEDCLTEIEKGYTRKTEVTDKNVEYIKGYLMNHWQNVLDHYEEQLEAGKIYYESILESCKRVVAIDVGWAGSGAVTLDYIVNNIWHLQCEIVGLVAGTNSAHNSEPNMSESQFFNGKLVSYLFSQGSNRDMWKSHNPTKGHNIIVEMLLSSNENSFVKFEYNEGEVEKRFENNKKENLSEQQVEMIQNGIKTFVKFASVFMKDIDTASICEILKLNYANKKYMQKITQLEDINTNI